MLLIIFCILEIASTVFTLFRMELVELLLVHECGVDVLTGFAWSGLHTSFL